MFDSPGDNRTALFFSNDVGIPLTYISNKIGESPAVFADEELVWVYIFVAVIMGIKHTSDDSVMTLQFPAASLAAGATLVMVRLYLDPYNPQRSDVVTDEGLPIGSSLTMMVQSCLTDEWGGGGGKVSLGSLNWGANTIYDIGDGELVWSLQNTCT